MYVTVLLTIAHLWIVWVLFCANTSCSWVRVTRECQFLPSTILVEHLQCVLRAEDMTQTFAFVELCSNSVPLTRFLKSSCKKQYSWKTADISAVLPSFQILALNQARPSEKCVLGPHCFDPWASGDGWGDAKDGVEFNGPGENAGPTLDNKSRVFNQSN